MILSLLDRSRTRAEEPATAGLSATIERARWAEELGFHRFWVAEHHGVPGVASGSPPVLLAALGAATRTIRLGSGGVMLPHHQPFVVVEQFRMLEALYPGRVDLAVGRSLGFTEPVRDALRHPSSLPDTFGDDVEELRAFLNDAGPITAQPSDGGPIPLQVLATGRGLALAARLGLPVVVGGPVLHSDALTEALGAYRRDFVPREGRDRPRVTVSFDAFVADDAATARHLALPEAWAMARSRQVGTFEPLRSPGQIEADLRHGQGGEQVRRRVEDSLAAAVAGTRAEVAARIDEIVTRAGAEEVLASTSTYDREALRELDSALRDLVD